MDDRRGAPLPPPPANLERSRRCNIDLDISLPAESLTIRQVLSTQAEGRHARILKQNRRRLDKGIGILVRGEIAATIKLLASRNVLKEC